MVSQRGFRLRSPKVDCEPNVGVGIPEGVACLERVRRQKRRPATNTVTGLYWPFQIVTPGIHGQSRACARRAVTRPSRVVPYL